MPEFNIHVYHHFPEDRSVLRRLDVIQASLRRIERKEADIMSFVTDMEARITAETDGITAVELVQTNLLQQIRDLIAANGTPAELQALLDKMDVNKARLAALAVQGTQG